MTEIKIKQIRQQKGITLRRLSAKSGISIAQISRIENNMQNPTIDTLCQLAYALGVPVTETFNFTPDNIQS